MHDYVTVSRAHLNSCVIRYLATSIMLDAPPNRSAHSEKTSIVSNLPPTAALN